MLIPYSTNAPNRHPPYGTFFLVAANIILFLLQDDVFPESIYVLDHDDGMINPLQWLGSAFGHAGPAHLIGNMFFLFAIGMAVESTLTTSRYLAVYFLIVLARGLGIDLLTTLFDFGSTGSLGASGAIFGIMVVGMLCVPDQEINCFYLWRFGAYLKWGTVEIPVLIFCAFHILWDVGMVLFSNFQMSTPFLHATGAVAGAAVGATVYLLGWYDSNGSDIVSLIREAYHGPEWAREQEAKARLLGVPDKHSELQKISSELEESLRFGGLNMAQKLIWQAKRHDPNFRLTEKQTIRMINLCCSRKEHEWAIHWINQYLTRFKTIADVVRLKKADILLHQFNSIEKAAVELAQIDRRKLNARQCRVLDNMGQAVIR